MGSPSRTHYHDALLARAKCPESCTWHRVLPIPSPSQHHPIALRISHWQHLPLLVTSPIFRSNLRIPVQRHRGPFTLNQYNILPGLTLRLCLTCPRRLPDIRPRKVLQAPTRYVPPHHPFSATIPALKVPHRARRHCRRRSLHRLPPADQLQVKSQVQPIRQLHLRPDSAGHQPPLRRPHKHNPRPHLHFPSPLRQVLRPANDGRAEHHGHPSHLFLPPPHPYDSTFTPARHGTSQRPRALLRNRLPPTPSQRSLRRPRFRGLWCRGSALHFCDVGTFLKSTPSHSDRDAKDAHDAPQCAVVWEAFDRRAVARRRVSIWRSGCRRLDTAARKEKEA